jgi:hypothetical protein
MKDFIELTVWGENWCDDYFMISNSYGYSLHTLIDIKEQLEEDTDVLKEYQESVITLKMTFSPAQVGNYPPPNIEVEEYWDWEVVKQEKFEDDPNYTGEGFEEELLNIF